MRPETPPDDSPDTPPAPLDARRRRILFRARHRGTKEADLLVGGFATRHVAAFSADELTALEAVLELPDVALTDWLSGRSAPPEDQRSPMLDRLIAESGLPGAGLPT